MLAVRRGECTGQALLDRSIIGKSPYASTAVKVGTACDECDTACGGVTPLDERKARALARPRIADDPQAPFLLYALRERTQ